MSWPLVRIIAVLGFAVVLVAPEIWYVTDAQESTPAGHHAGHGASGSATPAPSSYTGTFDAAAPIRALSSEEIDQIRRGEGAGFAKPAELNGVPGPRHVLDLAAELGLSAAQARDIQAIYDAMLAAVIPAGERYLAAEEALESDLRAGAITEADLPGRVSEVSRLEGDLATIHLTAHLQTARLLTPQQIATYNRLRGYTSDDTGS
jgi:hypothetical protein